MNVISFLSRAQTLRPPRAPRRCAALPGNSRSASVQPVKARSGGSRRGGTELLQGTPLQDLKIPAPDAGGGRGPRDIAALIGKRLLDVAPFEFVDDSKSPNGERYPLGDDSTDEILPRGLRWRCFVVHIDLPQRDVARHRVAEFPNVSGPRVITPFGQHVRRQFALTVELGKKAARQNPYVPLAMAQRGELDSTDCQTVKQVVAEPARLDFVIQIAA